MTTNVNVFKNGFFLATLMDQPSPMPNNILDNLCRIMTITAKSEVVFDWHPQGGRPMLLYLGDYELARNAFLANASNIRAAAEVHYHKWYKTSNYPEGEDPNFKSGLAYAKDIAEAGSKTMGQIWNG